MNEACWIISNRFQSLIILEWFWRNKFKLKLSINGIYFPFWRDNLQLLQKKTNLEVSEIPSHTCFRHLKVRWSREKTFHFEKVFEKETWDWEDGQLWCPLEWIPPPPRSVLSPLEFSPQLNNYLIFVLCSIHLILIKKFRHLFLEKLGLRDKY